MQVVSMTLDHALCVVRNMRERDAECVLAAMGPGIDAETFAVSRYQTDGPAWALVDDTGRALVIFGLTLCNAWSAVAWLVAVEGVSLQSWRKVIRTAVTVAANVLDPMHPYHRRRIEANVLEDWTEAQQLAQRLGLRKEGIRRCAGSAGQDIGLWAITDKD